MATKRRIGINPGSTDFIGAVDTDAKDANGATITSQVFTPGGPSGALAEVSVRGELSIEAASLQTLVEQNRVIILLLAALRMQMAEMTGSNFDDNDIASFVPTNVYDN